MSKKIQKSIDKIHEEVEKIEKEVAPKKVSTYGDPIVKIH